MTYGITWVTLLMCRGAQLVSKNSSSNSYLKYFFYRRFTLGRNIVVTILDRLEKK